MGCFCYDAIIKKKSWAARKMTFTDIDESDKEEYCMTWLVHYGTNIGVRYGAPLVIISLNIISSVLFKEIAPFIKFHTKNAETAFIFVNLTLL